MLKRKHLCYLLIILVSCSVKKNTPTRIELKPLKISAKPKVFRSNPDKEIDILHTEINVSFDWKKHLCHGTQRIKFKPYGQPVDSFRLDAKNFIIHKILLGGTEPAKIDFDTTYDNNQLVIYPKQALQINRTYGLLIQYTARPDSNNVAGGRAIKDAKGLYFINTDKTEPYKPTQIWTQGETESNSNWFATVDKPYEKMTFDINITVPDSLTTLSNGVLSKYEKHDDNMRTDSWKVREPMSAYLVMMAIGNFEKTKDENCYGKEVSYYLEPNYHPYAKGIFNNTRDMIYFFTSKLGTPYPWQKYSQVVVRDYVSGAMENTSATLHGEFVQKNHRELIDNQNDGIIAHELFHQWFGDLVTCESWSHLTLNEGFATFGEQLWFGHKYGKTDELKRIHKSMSSYLRSAKLNDKPIVRFYYKDKDEMFNARTYQKGARVLNLLKFELGEETFFKGVQKFLKKYSFKSAQIEHLRHELELVSGKDLRYFFNQWYLRGGHPVVDLTSDSDGTNTTVSIKQIQKDSLFSFPFQLRIGDSLMTVNCFKKKTKIQIPSTIHAHIYPDPNGIFIGEINNLTYTPADIKTHYQQAKNFIEKKRILESIKDKKKRNAEEDALMLFAINDKDPDLSHYAMKQIDWEEERNIDAAKEDLKRIATLEKNPKQKSQAIYLLSATNDKLLHKDFETWSQDSSYQIAAAGLFALNKIKPTEGLFLAKLYEPTAEAELFKVIANIYGNQADSNCTFFQDQLMRRFGSQREELIKTYGTWAERMGHKEQNTFWKLISQRASQDEKNWTRLASIYALNSLANNSDLISEQQKEQLKNIIKNEKNARVRRQLIVNKIIKTQANN